MSAVQNAVRTATRTWSEYQLNLFGDAAIGKGNRIVRAVAGSGKSTTGVEMVKRVKGSHIYLAFNRAIAKELENKGVNGRTFHSLCRTAVMNHKKTTQVEEHKLRRLVDAKLSGDEAEMYGSFVTRLVSLARNAGVGCLVPPTDQVFSDLADHHELEPDSEFADIGKALELAQQLLQWSNESPLIDFDDMLYLAVKDGLSLPKFDNVFVDEAQDTNAIQRAILRKIMKPTTRLFAVGDEAQAIYGFRGADSNSMQLLKDEFDCVEMPLTVTYRCGTSIVEYAQQWVSHIQAAPGAPTGRVEHLGNKWDPSMFAANDLVVCRTTAPVVSLAYRLLKARVPVKIQGREIGQGLKSLIKKMNATDIDHLLVKLDAWATRETEKATAKKQDSKVDAINDKKDCILCLIDSMDEDLRTISHLYAVIDKLFEDSVNVVTLSTIHRAKGLEADTVFWLNSEQCPSKWAKQDWQVQQEMNLMYVAVTRAKTRLVTIQERKEK